MKHLSAPEAAVSRDSLAKSIYAKLFDWLVAAINRKMSALGKSCDPEEREKSSNTRSPGHLVAGIYPGYQVSGQLSISFIASYHGLQQQVSVSSEKGVCL